LKHVVYAEGDLIVDRFSRPKSRERIETSVRGYPNHAEEVSPGRKAGSGLKLGSFREFGHEVPVSPGRKAGSGLKLVPVVVNQELDLVSPGRKAGSGLKRLQQFVSA